MSSMRATERDRPNLLLSAMEERLEQDTFAIFGMQEEEAADFNFVLSNRNRLLPFYNRVLASSNGGRQPLSQVEVDELAGKLLVNAIFFFLKAGRNTPRTTSAALAAAETSLPHTSRQKMARELKLIDVLFCMYRAPKDLGIADADLMGTNNTPELPKSTYLKAIVDIQKLIATLLTVSFRGMRASEFYIATTTYSGFNAVKYSGYYRGTEEVTHKSQLRKHLPRAELSSMVSSCSRMRKRRFDMGTRYSLVADL